MFSRYQRRILSLIAAVSSLGAVKTTTRSSGAANLYRTLILLTTRLDKDHSFTRLVVVMTHSAAHHNAVKDTLTDFVPTVNFVSIADWSLLAMPLHHCLTSEPPWIIFLHQSRLDWANIHQRCCDEKCI